MVEQKFVFRKLLKVSLTYTELVGSGKKILVSVFPVCKALKMLHW